MATNIQIPEDIKTFLNNLLDKAEIVPASEEAREAMLTELFIELDRYTNAKLIENIPLEYMDEFLTLQQKNDTKVLESFIMEKIPNAQQMYTDAFTEFGQIYIDNVVKARETQ